MARKINIPSGPFMKSHSLYHAAFAALIAAETLAVSPEGFAKSGTAKMDIALTIENACSIVTPGAPVEIDQASRVAVNCGGTKTPYRVGVEARSASGEALSLQSIEHASHVKDAAASTSVSGSENYPPIVAVTVQF